MRLIKIAVAFLMIGLLGFVIIPDQAVYLYRFFGWNLSDIEDYRRFPALKISAADRPFRFPVHETEFAQREWPVELKDGSTQTSSLRKIAEDHETTALIVLQHDAIVFEEYFNGYERNSINTSFSAAKSVTSLLLGIALDMGIVNSSDDPLGDYLKSDVHESLQNQSLQAYLHMFSGIRYESTGLFGLQIDMPWDERPQAYYYPNLRSKVANLRWEEELSGHYHYNDYHPFIIGLLLEEKTGTTPAKLLEEWVWQPMGAEFDASWSVDGERSTACKMESGLNGRAIDFLKLGALVLNQGQINGQQLISVEWLNACFTDQSTASLNWTSSATKETEGYWYSNFWWLRFYAPDDLEILASGHLGQYIYIRPKTKTVIVRMGKSKGQVNYWPNLFRSISEEI